MRKQSRITRWITACIMVFAAAATLQAAEQNPEDEQQPKIQVGEPAPAFTLPNQDGEPVSLSDYRGQWLVLYFYPKDFTPGCTTEACSFRDSIKMFEDMNTPVLGVSPDSPATHRKFIKKYNLPFTLLSDPQMRVMLRYGGAVKVKQNGETHKRVVRSTVLINPEGEIAYHWEHVKPLGHAKRVAKKLKALKQSYEQAESKT